MTDTRPNTDDQATLIAALRASEAKFSGILDIAADAIITIDESQRILHFNHGAEEIFGWRASDVLGHSLELLLPERFRATHALHGREHERGRQADAGHTQTLQFAEGQLLTLRAVLNKIDAHGSPYL